MIAINFAIKTNKNVFQTREWRRNKDILGKNWANNKIEQKISSLSKCYLCHFPLQLHLQQISVIKERKSFLSCPFLVKYGNKN